MTKLKQTSILRKKLKQEELYLTKLKKELEDAEKKKKKRDLYKLFKSSLETEKNMQLLGKKIITSHNPNDYSSAEGISNIYSKTPLIFEYSKKNGLNNFTYFFEKNVEETINLFLFKAHLINSDYLFHHLGLADTIEGTKYESEKPIQEVLKILVKNNEYNLLSGKHDIKLKPANNFIGFWEDENLPFQNSPLKQFTASTHFKLNYIIDFVENKKTKEELTELRNKRVKDLFFGLKIYQKPRWTYSLLQNIKVKHEVVLRERDIGGNDLIKKIDDVDQESAERLKRLDNRLYDIQFNQQKKVLYFMKKDGEKKYFPLLEKICDFQNDQ